MADSSKDATTGAEKRCPLCLNMAIPQRSHLFPQSVYKAVRGDDVNPHPYHFTANHQGQSSRQIWAHLLCSGCEQRLHHGGEDWTLKHLLRKDGTFLLRDLVIANSESGSVKDVVGYQARVGSSIDFEKLVYFAMSILWKASAYPWNGDGREIDLGALYFEQFRRYLMHEAPFPENAWVHLDITRPENRLKEVIGGLGNMRGRGYYIHFFLLPGVLFRISVGQLVPDDLRRTCALRHHIVTSHNHEVTISRLYRNMVS